MSQFNAIADTVIREIIDKLFKELKKDYQITLDSIKVKNPADLQECIPLEIPYEAVYTIKYTAGKKSKNQKDTVIIPLMSDYGLFYNGSTFQSGVSSLVRNTVVSCKSKNEVYIKPYVIKLKADEIIQGDVKMNLSDMDSGQLELPEETINVLRYKIREYDGSPMLTRQLIDLVIKNASLINTDDMIDYKLLSLDTAFSQYMRSAPVFWTILHSCKSSMARYDKLQLKELNGCIHKFFLGKVSKYKSNIQYVQLVNPLNMIALKSKIIVPPFFLINKTFFDVIDPVNTPVNNNGNRLNDINRCVSTDNGVLMMDVYDKDFNQVKIPYHQYVVSRVVLSKSVDYENKVVLDNPAIRCREEIIESDDYDFIQLPSDMRLSETLSMIPMVNSSDGPRLAMGAAMMKQSVELLSPEKPLVSSGNQLDSPLSIRSVVSGKVKEVTTEHVVVTSEDGDKVHKVPANIPTINSLTVNFEPKVKVGDEVKVGDILIDTRIDSNNMGCNMLVAFTTYKFFEHEDSVIISESAARKLQLVQTKILTYQIPAGSEIIRIAKLGDFVDAMSSLIDTKEPLQLSKSTKKLKNLIVDKPGGKKLVQHKLKDSVVSGIVTGISYAVSDDEDVPEILLRPQEPDIELDESYRRPMPKIKTPEEGMVIQIRVSVLNESLIGNKLTNRYGSKGTIGKVLPDSMRPVALIPKGSKDDMISKIFDIFDNEESPGDVEEVPIDIIMNPEAVYARKNYSQFNEAKLSFISLYLYKKYLESTNKLEFIETYGKYNPSIPKDPEELNDLVSRDGISAFGFVTGSYSSYNAISIDEMMEELGISNKVSLYYPEYDEITEPVEVGYQYILRLKQLPEAAMKMTSSVNKSSPILGMGSRRSKGQSINEMETKALISAGVDELVTELKDDGGKRKRRLGMHLLLSGSEVVE